MLYKVLKCIFGKITERLSYDENFRYKRVWTKKMELKKISQSSCYTMFQALLFVEAHFQSDNQYLSTT